MLTFPIKKVWFDMIRDGIKLDEYREDSPYYDSRLLKYEGKKIIVSYRAGYCANSPTIICAVIPHRRETGRPEWGAVEGVKYWRQEIKSVIRVFE